MKAIFLDRDGVINKDPGGWTPHNYVTNWKEFQFLSGAIDALKLLTSKGYDIIIVSNQGGVNKGYFSKEDLDKVNSKMLDEIGKKGARIKEVYYCVHRDEDNCNCRKPKPGMLEAAARKYDINFRDTCFIGDSHVDIVAGKTMGLKTVFVLSGKTSLEELRKLGDKPDHIFKDLLEAVKWLIAKEGRKWKRASKRRTEKERKKYIEKNTDSVRDSGDRP